MVSAAATAVCGCYIESRVNSGLTRTSCATDVPRVSEHDSRTCSTVGSRRATSCDRAAVAGAAVNAPLSADGRLAPTFGPRATLVRANEASSTGAPTNLWSKGLRPPSSQSSTCYSACCGSMVCPTGSRYWQGHAGSSSAWSSRQLARPGTSVDCYSSSMEGTRSARCSRCSELSFCASSTVSSGWRWTYLTRRWKSSLGYCSRPGCYHPRLA